MPIKIKTVSTKVSLQAEYFGIIRCQIEDTFDDWKACPYSGHLETKDGSRSYCRKNIADDRICFNRAKNTMYLAYKEKLLHQQNKEMRRWLDRQLNG